MRAKITDKDNASGRWLYAWIEQAITADGADVTAPAARFGATDYNYAVEINDHEVDVDTIVELRERGYATDVGLTYEFAYEPSATSSPSYIEQRCTSTSIAVDNVPYTVSTITIPSTGTWFVYASVTAVGQISAGAQGRMYFAVTSTGVTAPGMNMQAQFFRATSTGLGFYGYGSDQFIIPTVAAGTVLNLVVVRENGPTWAVAQVQGLPASGGSSHLGAFKIK